MDEQGENYDDFLRQARLEYGKAYYEEQAQARGLPFADLTKFRPEPAALNVVPKNVATRHNVIPLRKQENILWVAMSDPGNIQASDDLRLVSRCTIKAVLADPEMIRASITRFYTGQT